MTSIAESEQNKANVQPGTIMAALAWGGPPGSFHWIIYVSKFEGKSDGLGYKFHATDRVATAPWAYESQPWSAMKSQTCITLTPIGQITGWGTSKSEERCIEALDQVLRGVPLAVSALDIHDFPRFTCRAWFRAAIRRLHQYGYINCPEVLALEAKLKSSTTAIQIMGAKGARYMKPLVWPNYAPSLNKWFVPRELSLLTLNLCVFRNVTTYCDPDSESPTVVFF
ncbi:hypothetical protein C8T65DRAFT_827922 [Cerioporus squamosus]|nr:hypothetical protein C8T65DRAFT_827922 [Cerioporus squamosus]